MADYWVSTAGDDANPGTFAQPWETFDHAATTAVAGDNVTFMDGAYDCGGGQASWNSGDAIGGYVTFRAQNRRAAELQFTATSGRLIDMDGEQYIRFEGLCLKGRLDYGAQLVRLIDSDYIVFDDCEIYDSRGWAVYIVSCANLTLIRCTIHPENQVEDLSYDAIQIAGSGSEDITIERCEIYHADHDGIKVYEVDGCTIHRCTIRDTNSHPISIGGSGSDVARNVTVSYCTILDAGSWDPSPGAEQGIRIHDAIENVLIHHNDIAGCGGPGITCYDLTGTATLHHNSLYNNKIRRPDYDWGSILIGGTPTIDGFVNLYNNIIFHTQPNRSMSVESPWTLQVAMDYNLWRDSTGTERIRRGGVTYDSYAAYQAAGYEPNSIISLNPLFNNAGADDFTLQALSPAIDAGVYLNYAYRGAAPDMGAHEYPSTAVVYYIVVVVVIV